MLKNPAFKYVDCENIVLRSRADWDENRPTTFARVLSVSYIRRRGTWGRGGDEN